MIETCGPVQAKQRVSQGSQPTASTLHRPTSNRHVAPEVTRENDQVFTRAVRNHTQTNGIPMVSRRNTRHPKRCRATWHGTPWGAPLVLRMQTVGRLKPTGARMLPSTKDPQRGTSKACTPVSKYDMTQNNTKANSCRRARIRKRFHQGSRFPGIFAVGCNEVISAHGA